MSENTKPENDYRARGETKPEAKNTATLGFRKSDLPLRVVETGDYAVIEGQRVTIANEVSKEFAYGIVRAVNSHEALLEANEKTQAAINGLINRNPSFYTDPAYQELMAAWEALGMAYLKTRKENDTHAEARP